MCSALCRISIMLVLVSGGACGGGDDGGSGDPIDAASGDDASGGQSYSLRWGPITVAPGVEDTRCVTLRLPNPGPVKIHRMHNVLTSASHHLIVYRDNGATQESTTPAPCSPFAGALDLDGTASPIMITQRADEQLELPDGVAYTFAAQQFIRLEMHYINTTDAPIEASATTEVFTIPDEEARFEADFLFIGSPDIDFTLQPGASANLQAYFPVPASLDGSNYFAITGHTHHFGVDMNVASAPGAAAARTTVYDPSPFSWSEPETARHDPPFTVPPGGGFDFSCEWRNPEAAPVTVQFGESANDEMCFFWAYYYPSHGAKVCFHTTRFGGLDLCCPDAGASICNAVGGQL